MPLSPGTIAASPDVRPLLARSDDRFLEYVSELPALQISTYQSTMLQDIIDQTRHSGRDATLLSLASYMLDIFSAKIRSREIPVSTKTVPITPKSRRQLRRHEYTLTQRNFYKHQSRCIKKILEGQNTSSLPPKEIIEPFWRAVMSKECALTLPNENLHQALDPI